jgi:hypothetical protein
MDSYIVRVYRRGKDNPDEISGLVETVGNSQRKSFDTLKGLMTVLRQVVSSEGKFSASITSLNRVKGGE